MVFEIQCIFGHKKPHLDLGGWKDVQLLRCTSLPFRRPSTTNPPSLTTHPHSNYHTHPIVISKIPANPTTSPSPDSPRHFQSAPSPPPKPPTPPTASKSPPPPPIPPCRCLPTSTSAQHLKSVRRKPYCQQSPPPSQPVQTIPRQSNGRALSPHARSCRYQG